MVKIALEKVLKVSGEIDLVDRAIGFAARAHQGQWRKTGERMPYIAHPFGVAMILQEIGSSEVVVAAGLLHDTVEDTKVTIEEIRYVFGDPVADIVAGCTELPKKSYSWEERKKHTIESLRSASLEVKIVSAADKYHNLNHTLASAKIVGPSLWKRFGRERGQQAWYYRSVYESILENVAEPENYPVFPMLGDVINKLFAGIASEPPQ